MLSKDFLVEEPTTPAIDFIKDMYTKYPRNPVNNNEFVMVYGEGEDQKIACFELTTSPRGPNWVYLKFFHTYPQKQGVGTMALKQLQDHAREQHIKMDLYTWDKGQVSANKLKNFYRRSGFTPISKVAGPVTMTWDPDTLKESTSDDLHSVAEWFDTSADNIKVDMKQEPIDKFLKQIKEMYSTYDEFPKDAIRIDDIVKILKRGGHPLPIYVAADDPDLFVMEGRHRMVAFWLVGLKTIPVAYVSKKNK